MAKFYIGLFEKVNFNLIQYQQMVMNLYNTVGMLGMPKEKKICLLVLVHDRSKYNLLSYFHISQKTVCLFVKLIKLCHSDSCFELTMTTLKPASELSF